MAWTVACACGELWYGEPPDACPQCGRTISHGIRIAQPPPPWTITNQDEIGQHTTTTDQGEAW